MRIFAKEGFCMVALLLSASGANRWRKGGNMKFNLNPRSAGKSKFPLVRMLAVAALAAASLCPSSQAQTVPSGQRANGQYEVEPAFNDSTGNAIYLLSPLKNPTPSRANPTATAPFFEVLYPLSSTIPASDLNCQPTNCDHGNVLPFPDTDYGALLGTDQVCTDFNGSAPCSPVKGHDHLVGVASSRGDFNVAWHVWLVIFTHSAFVDGVINTRVTTLSQLQALVANGDAFYIDTGFVFNCSVTSKRTYEIGTPVAIQYP